jgi:hypothetical protein
MGNKSVAIDPSFDYGAPLRLMGQFYQNLPLIAGQDYGKAADFYQRAIQTAPCMERSHFYLAELYRLDKKWDKARAAVEAGLAAPACPNGAHAWEKGFFRGELQKLQGSLPAK